MKAEPQEARPKGLMATFANKYGVDPARMSQTLKATAFRQANGQEITNEQMMALVVVAHEHGLNPFTKEIYAFPDRNQGVVPIVGVDGWARIINQHPQFDGMRFDAPEADLNSVPEWMECTIYRKDRNHPTAVREYFAEVRRDTAPWKSHPRRMLRHKTMIQCARLAFAFTGIYDQDEGERIIEGQIVERAQEPARPVLEPYPDDRFEANLPDWRNAIEAGLATPDDIIDKISTRGQLTQEQTQRIRDCETAKQEAAPCPE